MNLQEERLIDAFRAENRRELHLSYAPDTGATASIRGHILSDLLRNRANLQGVPSSRLTVSLSNLTIAGDVDLSAATLNYDLELLNCRFSNGFIYLDDLRGFALTLVGCSIQGTVSGKRLLLEGDLKILGCLLYAGLSLFCATVNGQLSLNGTHLKSDLVGIAFNGDGLAVSNGMFCRYGFTSFGLFRAKSARIGHYFECSDARFLNEESKTAILLDSSRVSGSTAFGPNLMCKGDFSVIGAEFSDQLVFSSFAIKASLRALKADRVRVDGDLVIEDARLNGELRLSGSTISGQCQLVRCSVLSKTATIPSLTLEGMTVQQGVFLLDSHFRGESRLIGAQVTDVLAQFCTFEGLLPQSALALDRLHAMGNVKVVESTVQGKLQLNGAEVEGQLDLSETHLEAWPPDSALIAERLRVKNEIVWKPASVAGHASFNLCSTGGWVDDPRSMQFPVSMNGAHYERLQAPVDPRSVSERLAWLRNSPDGYSPQPYLELASVLRREGHEQQAKVVLVESRTLESRTGTGVYGFWLRVAGVVLLKTVGYGYRPWRALGWLVGLIAAGAVAVSVLPKTYVQGANSAGTAFNPLFYSIDLVLPFVDLGSGRFHLVGAASWLELALMLSGWVLATVLVTAFALLLRRGE